ncbi:MAG: ATP-binding protein [Acidobacteria bacterium]|nr:ATP-binding protein [Acidobacteriota bacterium]
MILAVASGKGGTGKTTVAVNLAACLPEPVRLLDCDVEEPNCHIFLKPEIHSSERFTLPFPTVDDNRCNGCGECSRICEYNAIVSLKSKPLVFPELCHGCGGCVEVCPEKAITESRREIGTIRSGTWRHVAFVEGLLDVGQTLSPPLIRAVKQHVGTGGITVIDCPPGTSCPVIAAVHKSDYVVLVSESSPFGLHDLALAVDTMRKLDLNFGVVINRAGPMDHRVADYCRKERIPILMEIPDERKAAEAYSRGLLLIESVPGFRKLFENLYRRILSESRRNPGSMQGDRRDVEGIA